MSVGQGLRQEAAPAPCTVCTGPRLPDPSSTCGWVFFVPPPTNEEAEARRIEGTCPVLPAPPLPHPLCRGCRREGQSWERTGLARLELHFLWRPLAFMTGCWLSPPSLAPREPPLPEAWSWRPGEQVVVPRLALATVPVQNTCFPTKAVFSLGGGVLRLRWPAWLLGDSRPGLFGQGIQEPGRSCLRTGPQECTGSPANEGQALAPLLLTPTCCTCDFLHCMTNGI